MATYDRAAALAGAEQILEQDGWCVYEVCLDVSRQDWVARVVIFDVAAEAVAAAVEDEIGFEPEHDARLTGADRRTLQPLEAMGQHLCYLSDAPAVQERPRRSPELT